MERLRKLSLSGQIVVGIAAGLLFGLFVGEPAGHLQIVGDAFVQLLQMAVLPYVLFSLMAAVGKLSVADAKLLAKIGGLLLLGSWALTYAVILAAPLAFPSWESASFFSTSLVQDPPTVDLLGLYVPDNPFHSLANNVVPAVVVFALAVGVALIGVGGKEKLLGVLDVVIEALTRVTNFVAKLTPIGMFAITASAAGTMSVDEVSRLQVYFIVYTNASLAMTFWVIPALVSRLTPVPYRSIFSVTGDALMTGFATGNLFIILPLMTEGCKKILRDADLGGEDSDRAIDVLMPVFFNFPLAGKLLTLIFVPFAAWFVGVPIEPGRYPTLVVSSLVSYFGSVNVAMPFLLDLLRIPADMFELYLVTGVVNSRFATLLSAVNMIAISLLGACLMTGRVRIPWRRLIPYGVISLLVVVAAVAGARVILGFTFTSEYDKDEVLAGMRIVGDQVPSSVQVHPTRNWVPRSLIPRGVKGIRERGRLRVGYLPDNIPFSYQNDQGDLVGLDIELAHRLAEDLGVGLTFIALRLDEIDTMLESRKIDIGMAGIPLSELVRADMALTQPYLELTLAFIVGDHARSRFATWQDMSAIPDLRIAVVEDHYFEPKLERAFPDAEIVELNSAREFFEDRSSDADALLYTAEAGATWTLLYPDFSVVVPRPESPVMPIAFAVEREDDELRVFLDRWIELSTGTGVIRRAYDHWVLGVGAVEEKPRWSIVRDVLHWID